MTSPTETYTRLAAHFDRHFSDTRGGVKLEYLTGEQVISRLNEVLGVAHWSFRVLRHDIHTEADEAWALGELAAEIDGQPVVRQQFGSQKIKRSRSTGQPLDIGFDLKGAATDALKKCATLVGVGLYLSEKDGGIPQHLCESCDQPVLAQDGHPINDNQAQQLTGLFGAVLCKPCRQNAPRQPASSAPPATVPA